MSDKRERIPATFLAALREAGMSYREISDFTEKATGHRQSVDTVRGRIGRHNRSGKQGAGTQPAPPNTDTMDSDDEEIRDRIGSLMRSNRWLTVLLESDHHFVDHDPTALMLRHQILQHVRPDICILNGDTLDFGAVSAFLQSRRLPKRDVLKEVEIPYGEYIDTSVNLSPSTLFIHNSGNHNARLTNYLDSSWQTASTVEEAYFKLLRQDGRVLCTGWGEDLLVGNLYVQHGERVGENAAKLSLLDKGMVNYAQGHSHQPALYYRSVMRLHDGDLVPQVITSAVTGCLSRIPPVYSRDRVRHHSKWIQSVAIAHISTVDWVVDVQQIIFHRRDKGLVAAFGGEVFYQEETEDSYG